MSAAPSPAGAPDLPRFARATVRKAGAALVVAASDSRGNSAVAATLDEPGVAAGVERLAAAWREGDLLASERRSRRDAGTTRAERLAFGALDLACAELACAHLGVPLAVLAGASPGAPVAALAAVPADAIDADALPDAAALGRACLERDANAIVLSLPHAGGLAGVRRIAAVARACNLQPVVRLVTGTDVERAQAAQLAAAFGLTVASTSLGRPRSTHRPSRIRRVRLRRIRLPLVQVYVSAMYITDHMPRTLVEVETDDGFVGLGETHGMDEVHRLAAKIAKGWIGADALDRRGLARGFARIPFENRNGRNGWQALAGLETACADVAAKRFGVPLARLLGAAEDATSVRAVCVLPSAILPGVVPRADLAAHFADPGNAARVVEYAVAARERHGFGCFKYKSAGVGAAWDLAVMRGLRAALGPDAQLRIDPNAAYGTAEAVEVCRALETLALEYYEDPTDGIEGLARVRRQVSRPTASNMAAIEFAHLAPAARRGAPDIVLADLFLWGGVEHYRDMAAAVDAFGLRCAVHSFYESGVATAANVHLALGLGLTAHANDQGHDGLAADVLAPGVLAVRDGRIALPPGPGLGVALDEARVRQLLIDETIVE
jgi:L-alanine-DL-glutamate epimerase-like enolase superfamily enzyme